MECTFHYKEGVNVRYVYARELKNDNGISGGDTVKVDAALKNVIDSKPDLIMSLNTVAVQRLKALTATSSIPVIFMGIFNPSIVDPVIVSDFSHPGANLTGSMSGVTDAKRMEWFKRIVPTIKRLYAPYSPKDPSAAASKQQAEDAAKKLGIELVTKEVFNNDDITSAIQNIPDVDGIWLVADGAVSSRANDLAAAAIKRKLPFVGINPVHASGGALFSFGFDITATGVQSARLADQVLRGVKPSDLPVETSEFFLYINLDTAKAIGINIPDNILLSANEVITNGISATATSLPDSCKSAAAAGQTTVAGTTPTAIPSVIPTQAPSNAPSPTKRDF